MAYTPWYSPIKKARTWAWKAGVHARSGLSAGAQATVRPGSAAR